MDASSSIDQSSSVSETNEQYEQDQVVWGKIQGYPWWPGYIGQVIQGGHPSYNVFFFGDDSHSRLNPDKLRKFQLFFPDFAPQAKRNQRLKEALDIVHRQLRENGEDVSYFDVQSEPKKRGRKKKSQRFKGIKREAVKIEDNAEGVPAAPKRGRGRPRKIKLEAPPAAIEHPVKIQDIVEVKQQANENPQIIMVNRPAMMQEQEHFVKLQESEQPIPPTQDTYTRPACKQILAVKRLMQRNQYKKAVKELYDIDITTENVIDLLQSSIIPALQNHTNPRLLFKLKRKAKKMLVDRYFSKHSHSLQTLTPGSLRGKVVRRLFALIKKECPCQWAPKQLALKLQEKLERRNVWSSKEYMTGLLCLVDSLGVLLHAFRSQASSNDNRSISDR